MLLLPATLPATTAVEIQASAAAPERAAALPTVLHAAPEAPARPAKRVLIGAKWRAGPTPLAPDASLLQTALLDERTDPAHHWPWYEAAARAFWRWC